jgi:hypothetical protein
MNIVRSTLIVTCLIANSMFSFQSDAATFSTDATWLATDNSPGNGWNTDLAFSTSEWVNAVTVNSMNYIWHPNQNYSWGQQIWFRQIIDIPVSFGTATLKASEDDDAQVYVNGHMVVNDTNGIATDNPTVSIEGYLNPGQNLVAVVARDTYCCGRGFYARINVTPVPLPESYLMMTMGLGFLCATMYRRKTKGHQETSNIVA